MTAARERIQIYLPAPVAARVRAIAAARNVSINDAVRMAVGILDVAERARIDGHYVGVSSDRRKLDTVMVAPL